MFNKQLKRNIQAVDVKIGKLYEDLNKATSDDEKETILSMIHELADLRNKLSETKARESVASVVIPGAIGLAAIFMVIRHEETNVISTKALGLATKLFRG